MTRREYKRAWTRLDRAKRAYCARRRCFVCEERRHCCHREPGVVQAEAEAAIDAARAEKEGE